MKKITPFRLLLPVLGLWLGLAGCSEEIKPTPYTYTQLLTGKESKSWRLTSVQVFDEGNGSGNIDIRQVFPECVADDIYVFYNNDVKTFEVQEGATKCNSTDPDVYIDDTWSFVANTSTLNFVLSAITTQKIPWTVKSLSERSMTVEFYFQDFDASYRFTFTAQSGG